ncbi:MAG: hypothetical protein CMM07_16905 [Rhodopirellula sp.]|nr:hypothetical protein [Rhodopirellula sp.]
MLFRLPHFLLALVTTVCGASGCNQPTPNPNPPQRSIQTGGNYGPPTSAQLAGSSSSHRTGGEKYNFQWSFATSTFSLEGEDIPADLISAILGNNTQTTSIKGKWEINGKMLRLSTESYDDTGPRSVSLPIMNTGVIRVTTPEAQYVFRSKNEDRDNFN